jgi:putative transposase
MKSLEIKLKEDEVKFLNEFIKKGIKKARAILRANILLAANKGEQDTRIAYALRNRYP